MHLNYLKDVFSYLKDVFFIFKRIIEKFDLKQYYLYFLFDIT